MSRFVLQSFLLLCDQICDFTGQQHFFVVAITQTFLDAAFPNYKFIWWLKKKKTCENFRLLSFFRYSCSSIASGFDVKKRPESGTRKWLQMELACFYTACAHCSLWNNCGNNLLWVLPDKNHQCYFISRGIGYILILVWYSQLNQTGNRLLFGFLFSCLLCVLLNIQST